MIIQGNYTRVTLAVYGEVITEPVATPVSYEPMPLPDVTRHRLPPALDLCNTAEPVFLARELLALDPDAPPLSLVIRLMCCLRAPDEHWDPPIFPYSNMEESINSDSLGVDWLAEAIDSVMIPISPEINDDILEKFTSKVLNITSEQVKNYVTALRGLTILYQTNNNLYMTARLLRNASAQPTCLLTKLLVSLISTTYNPADISF